MNMLTDESSHARSDEVTSAHASTNSKYFTINEKQASCPIVGEAPYNIHMQWASRPIRSKSFPVLRTNGLLARLPYVNE